MTVNAFAYIAALRNLHGTGNNRIEDTNACAEVIPQCLHDLLCVLCMNVYAGQQDAVNDELRIEGTPRLGDRSQKNVEPLGGKIGGMTRNDYAVSGNQGIDCHQSQRGETVDQNVVILTAKRIHDSFEDELVVGEGSQCGAYAGQLEIARNEIHAFSVMENGRMGIERTVHNDTVHEGGEGEVEVREILLTKTDGQAALRVSVDQQNLLASAGKTDAVVHSGRCLANAALLVDD